jgi:hypothetical protein
MEAFCTLSTSAVILCLALRMYGNALKSRWRLPCITALGYCKLESEDQMDTIKIFGMWPLHEQLSKPTLYLDTLEPHQWGVATMVWDCVRQRLKLVEFSEP